MTTTTAIRTFEDLGKEIAARAAVSTDLGFIREGTVDFSPRQMQIVLDRCAYEEERGLDATHIKVLTDLMVSNRWRPKDPLDFAILDGQPILVNGYHRAHAQIAAQRIITWTVIFHEVATLDEVGMLFWRYDTNVRLRTPAQLLAAAHYADTHGLRKQAAAALYAAVPIIAANFPTSIGEMDVLVNRVVDRRLELAEPYVPAAQIYQWCVDGARQIVQRKLLRATTAAVALATLRFQPEMAKLFWTGVADNDGLAKGDPRQALFNHFLQQSKRPGSMLTHHLGPPAICWNAFYEHRQLAYVKVPGNWRVHIAGTPWAYQRPEPQR